MLSLERGLDAIANAIRGTFSTSVPAHPYKFSVYRSAALTSSTTPTNIDWDIKAYDHNSDFDLTTNLYTAPVSGVYLFSGVAGNSAATGLMYITLYVNGVLTEYGQVITNATGNNREQGAWQVSLNAGDTVAMYFTGGSGSTMSVGRENCHFSGHLLSRDFAPLNASSIDTEPWASWTPTLTNLTLGNGTVTAKYMQLGKTIHFRFTFTLGSSSAVGASPTFTLPATSMTYAQSGTAQAPVGKCSYEDTGTAAYVGYGRIASASATCVLIAHVSSGTYTSMAGLSATIPFTWATGDSIICVGSYESA